MIVVTYLTDFIVFMFFYGLLIYSSTQEGNSVSDGFDDFNGVFLTKLTELLPIKIDLAHCNKVYLPLIIGVNANPSHYQLKNMGVQQ